VGVTQLRKIENREKSSTDLEISKVQDSVVTVIEQMLQEFS
jgi:hypothetical protein